jgi:hypothetical protein
MVGDVRTQDGDQFAFTRQATAVGEDLVSQMGGEVALKLVQPLV